MSTKKARKRTQRVGRSSEKKRIRKEKKVGVVTEAVMEVPERIIQQEIEELGSAIKQAETLELEPKATLPIEFSEAWFDVDKVLKKIFNGD